MPKQFDLLIFDWDGTLMDSAGVIVDSIQRACMDIGRNQIVEAVAAGSPTPEAVGDVTRAGTNCGSCRAEIGRLIDAARIQKAG